MAIGNKSRGGLPFLTMPIHLLQAVCMVELRNCALRVVRTAPTIFMPPFVIDDQRTPTSPKQHKSDWQILWTTDTLRPWQKPRPAACMNMELFEKVLLARPVGDDLSGLALGDCGIGALVAAIESRGLW